jgi:uncharacterized protein
MIVSKYTICFDIDNKEFYIYNTLSNALIEIDEISYDQINKIKQNVLPFSEELINKDLYALLLKKRFVVDNDKDELLEYKATIMSVRSQKEYMHLTIAPTMDCNFRCHYCFETNKNRHYMSGETMDAIVHYVSSIKELKHIHLTWFGGEPLMAKSEMRLFYEKLIAKWDKTIDSEIITTGYYLSNDSVQLFKDLQVKSVQITLDGDQESHNKIKYTNDCNDVFTKVLDNIDMLTTLAPEIHIVFRINLTKMNSSEYVELFKKLCTRFKGKNIGITPAFVKNRTNSMCESLNSLYYFNSKEMAEFILDLYHNHRIHSPWLRYPRRLIAECAIRDQRAISFDPDGYAYKCWEKIGDVKYAIGQINEEGMLTNINPTVLNRQLYGADPLDTPKCTKCIYLPICNGGCPIQRIQNEFEEANNDVCSLYKGYIIEFLKAHIQLKKMGYDNF